MALHRKRVKKLYASEHKEGRRGRFIAPTADLSAIEVLAMEMSGDLAYSVWIEKGEVRVAGREELSPLAIRVTHIYRREDGSWKIIHRHGDAITEKIEATAVLQQ